MDGPWLTAVARVKIVLALILFHERICSLGGNKLRGLLFQDMSGAAKHIRYIKSPTFFSCPCNRVENESRQKKAAAQTKMVKDEDPYGGSTDENTDAEAEQDHPIPELPGTPALISASSSVPCLSCSTVMGTNVLRCLSGIGKSDEE